MSISVTVSGEDATSVVLEQVLSDAVTVSGSNSIQVTTTSGDAATVTISTGDPVTVTSNYSNYVTGDVVRPNEISDFLTSAQISSNINSAIDSLIDSAPDALNTLNELAAALNDDENFGSDTIVSISNLNSATGQLSTATGLLVQKSETGIFYTNDNPSGFITGVDLSDLEAATGNLDSRITSNDGDISALQTATGLLVQKSETGSFISESQTGQFYASSNPSGFITGVDLSYLETATGNLDSRIASNDGDISDLQTATGLLVQKTETGDFVTTFDTGAFYANSNPSGFITGVDLSSYVQNSETGNFITDSDTGAFYAASNPSGFITGVDLSSYVQNSETGLFLVSGEDAVVNTIGVGGSPDSDIDIHVKSNSAKFLVENTLGGGEWVRFSAGTVGSSMKFSNTASFSIGPVASKTDTSLVDDFYMASNGNIGIGTNTPSAKLDVAAASNAFITSTETTYGTKASFTAYSVSNNYPRAVFRIGDSASDNNVALAVNAENSSAGNNIPSFIFLGNNKDFNDAGYQSLYMGMDANGNGKIATAGQNNGSDSGGSLTLGRGVNRNNIVIESNDDIVFNTNDLFIDASTSNVGIGQTNPAAPLSVNGNVLVNTNNPDVDGTPLVVRGNTNFHGIAIKSPRSPRIYFDEGADGSETELAFFGIQDTDNAFVMRNWGGSSNDLLFAVQGGGGRAAAASSEALQLFHNGQMTLNAAWTAGITDSQLYMHVPSASIKGITVDGAVGQTANLQEWKVNGTALSVVDSDGNFGIGTDTPNYKLDVNGQINAYSSTYPVLKFTRETTTAGTNGDFSDTQGIASAMQLITKSTNNITDGFGGGIVFSILDDTFSNETQPIARIYARRDGADNRGALQFFTQGSSSITPSMIIRNDGNVGIGTDTPSVKLDVSGDANIDGTLTVDKISLSDNSFIVETGDFTLSDSHKGATILLQNTAAITITIPALSAGHTTSFIAETANTVTFQTGVGISGFNSFGNANQIAGIFGQAQVLYKTSDYAFLGGNIS